MFSPDSSSLIENPPLRASGIRLLLITLFLIVIPHGSHLPFWVLPTVTLLFIWRYRIHSKGLPLPSRKLMILLMLVGIKVIFLTHHSLLGREAALTLLTLMMALKLLEMNTQRDRLLVIFLAYFLVITNFFYSQSIPLAIYMFVLVLAITMTLIEITDPTDAISFRRNGRLAATLLLQALPLMLVLFVLFPRIGGPIWGLPKDATQARTGLSSTMAPGKISQLSQSDAVAFRVDFEDQIPPPVQRYWRGPVFYHTDGKNWKKGIQNQIRARTSNPPFSPLSKGIQYRVTLEPHDAKWLLALDLPHQAPDAGYMNLEYQLLSREEVKNRIQYSLVSYPTFNTGPRLSAKVMRAALQLPALVSQRVRDLAQDWRDASAGDDRLVVQAALDHFRRQPFVYTLNPPLLESDPVDEFLFDTRRGFCEHYSASFTILMRLAGIPTRVVTGYQGGEFNDLGGYLVVRQADAHAWTEVWIKEHGWTRVDPTAAVAPERIERPIDNTPGLEGVAIRFLRDNPSFFLKQWWYMESVWDSINHNWNTWVLAYGPEKQLKLLQQFGFGGVGWQGMVTGLAIALALLLMATATLMWHQNRRSQDPVVRAYQKFCHRLARHGYLRQRHEGPQAFCQRVSRQQPRWSPQIARICGIYIDMRYRQGMTKEKLRAFNRAVLAFRP